MTIVVSKILYWPFGLHTICHSKQHQSSVVLLFSCWAVHPNWRKIYAFHNMYISVNQKELCNNKSLQINDKNKCFHFMYKFFTTRQTRALPLWRNFSTTHQTRVYRPQDWGEHIFFTIKFCKAIRRTDERIATYIFVILAKRLFKPVKKLIFWKICNSFDPESIFWQIYSSFHSFDGESNSLNPFNGTISKMNLLFDVVKLIKYIS